MRPFTLLPAALVTGCLIQNPGFDAGQTTDAATTGAATTAAATTEGDITGLSATTEPGTTADDSTLGGTFGGSTSTGNPDSTSTATTGCALEPLFPDDDGDGFGAGAAVPTCPGEPGFSGIDGDCDDTNNTVNPDATEICNDLDDDCDALKDEFSAANLSCVDCELAAFAGHSYWFCTNTLGWDDARAYCQAFGAELPIVDDKLENDFIFAGNAVAASPMWVGGRDIDPKMNAHYTWYDGSPLSFNNFALADLDDGCIAMPNGDNGQWRDRDCDFIYSFACESTH